jgi:hypothetical protein
METPISAILNNEEQGVQTDGTAGFAVGPDNVQSQQVPLPVPVPSGASQGNTTAGPAGLGLKEFFNFQSDDLLSVILVFGLLLLVSSGVLNSFLNSAGPIFITNDKLTPVGAIVVSAVFAILYFIIKVIGRKFF